VGREDCPLSAACQCSDSEIPIHPTLHVAPELAIRDLAFLSDQLG
jgi:hypothetical protein